MKRTSPPLLCVAGLLLGASGVQSIAAFTAADAAPPSRILLMPFGKNVMGDGRAVIILKDKAHAQAVVAATQKRLGTRRFMIDYDHQAVKVSGDDYAGTAEAAGWGSGFEIDDRGIWATVEWTPAAAAKIAAREYLYISPWFHINKDTGELIDFINAALVNQPALELEALAASLGARNHTPPTDDLNKEDEAMNLQAIAAALGLPEDADEKTVLAAIGNLSATSTAVAAALKVEGDGDVVAAATQALAAAGAKKPDPTAYVPIAAFNELKGELGVLTAARHDGVIAAAMKAGKLTPAQEPWARDLLKDGQEVVLASFLESAPVIAGGPSPRAKVPGVTVAVTDDEIQIAASMGISKEDFLAARKIEGTV